MLKLSDEAPEVLRGLLRQWDGYVTTLRSPPLDAGDRLLPMMRLAVPGLGVRLGAAMALACVVTGKPTSDWEWLSDPLAPKVFRTVLRLMLAEFQPEWHTWTGRSKERGKIRGIHQKTIRRWDSGDVPGPQNIATLVEDVGAPSEGPLRWARAAMVARRDLEEWVGKEAATSWREALRITAMRVGPALATDPRAVPRIAALWAESLAAAPDRQLAERLASVIRLVDTSIGVETVESWLHGIAAKAATALPIAPREVRAVLLLSVLLPHPRLVAATYTHLDPVRAQVMAGADFRTLLNAEWSLRYLLRAVERGEPIRRQTSNGSAETVQITESMREAARCVLLESCRFVRSSSANDASSTDVAAHAILANIFGISSAQYAAALCKAEATLAYTVLDSRAEALLPEGVVCELPKLAIARALRLAESGDVEGAMAMLTAIDLSAYEPDASERADLAGILSELAHWTLDKVYLCLRDVLAEFRSAGLVDGTPSPPVLAKLLGESIEGILVESDRLIDAAVRWIAPQSLKAPQVEAVVLSFPYHLRRERVCGALGRSSQGASKLKALVEFLNEHAERVANDGEVTAMLALARDLKCDGSEWVPKVIDHRCEHLGTAALRNRWLMRIKRDLASP